jgi:hypothetical protein
VPAIQQILNEFNQTLGVRGLRREIFVIDDDVTVSIDCFEIDGFGERAHDEEEEEDRQDPQCRNNKLASLLWYFDVDTLFITDTILGVGEPTASPTIKLTTLLPTKAIIQSVVLLPMI